MCIRDSSGAGVGSAAHSGRVDWTFSIDNALTQYLAADQSIDVTYRITITDDSGVKNDPEAETETQDVVITINGANDDPVLSVSSLLNSEAESLTETDAALTTSGTLTATDIDLTNTVSISNISVNKGDTTDGLISNDTELLNMLSVSPVQVLDGTQTVNQFTWSFDSAPVANTNPESFDYLANGETLTLTYTLTLSDGESGSTPDTHNIVITINGTNDDPQITGVVTTASLTETDAALSASGTLTVADIDKSNLVNTSHSLVVSSNNNSALTTDVDGNVVPADPNGSTHAQLLAMLSLDANPLLDATEQSDTLNWSFNSNVTGLNHNQAFDYLEFGENLVLTYTITCLLYTSPSPRDATLSRMPSSA